MERLTFTAVDEVYWHYYRPISRALTSFEVWAMNMVYECLWHESSGEKKYEVNKGDNFRVEDDGYVYNAEYIIRNKHKARGMMYLAQNGRLMLEFRFDNGNIDELYICD